MSLIKGFNFECCVSFTFILAPKSEQVPLLRESTPNARLAFGGCDMSVEAT
ncbi:hypothetical protein J4G08_03495 [Candidatus Poribacteria bacterium]|nr:hypothetical protein [Candidatus Poribacteria bacterium]